MPLPPAPHAKPTHLKHVLVIGQTKGFEHDSISAAMASIYDMGKSSGLWDTEMRTDTRVAYQERPSVETPKTSTTSDLLYLRQHHRRA